MTCTKISRSQLPTNVSSAFPSHFSLEEKELNITHVYLVLLGNEGEGRNKFRDYEQIKKGTHLSSCMLTFFIN